MVESVLKSIFYSHKSLLAIGNASKLRVLNSFTKEKVRLIKS